MTVSTTPVYIESSRTRTFACAYDWPGWCRSGKDEASALAALAAYAPRYAAVAKRARVAFDAKPSFRVVERLASLVQAAWGVYDRILAGTPAELRKGPRGGGRDREKMADHVRDAEGAYVRKLGLPLAPPDRHDRRALAQFRAAIAEAVQRPSNGAALVAKGWPQRYAARRIAWHALDHAWEMQDRSDPSKD